jgi:hypothetical protein
MRFMQPMDRKVLKVLKGQPVRRDLRERMGQRELLVQRDHRVQLD